MNEQNYAIIENGIVSRVIIIDSDKYSLEETQIFGNGNSVILLPDDYGIGDSYDPQTAKWTKNHEAGE